MDPYDQLEEALSLLRETGMTRSSYAPPWHRWLWRRGIPVRPPQFAPFSLNVLNNAVWFGPLWGAIMGLLVWSGQGHPWWLMVGASVLAGLLFGVLMALFYRASARKNRLPAWEEIPHLPEKPWLERRDRP
ncbi:MAG: DUF6404 family protein [Oleiphilaceae bacterium]|nr:DUF6404 family protein [Oleiphilaceae bacterium]